MGLLHINDVGPFVGVSQKLCLFSYMCRESGCLIWSCNQLASSTPMVEEFWMGFSHNKVELYGYWFVHLRS